MRPNFAMTALAFSLIEVFAADIEREDIGLAAGVGDFLRNGA